MLIDQCTIQRGPAGTIAAYIHGSTEPLLYAQPALACAPACATHARTVSRNCRNTESKVRTVCRTFSSPPGIDSSVHLMPILAQQFAQAARGCVQVESRTSFTLPLVVHHTQAHSSATTRALNNQPLPADVHTTAVQVAAQECAVRTTAHHPLCVQPSHGRTDNRSASRTGVRNSGAPTVAQLPEHRTGTSAQPEQELRQHGCTLHVAIARARVTTTPSFLKQNGGTYGVIKR